MKYVDYDGLLYFWQKLKAFFATATDLEALDDKVDGIVAEGGEPNVIETVKVDGTALPVASKAVNIDLSGKANLASPEFSGTPKAPTATTGTNNTQIATTAFVKAQITADIAGKANIASPEFTGTPKAPTATTGTNTTQIATTAFVKAQIAADIASKADSATTLDGYGITNAYTKTETDTQISNAISGVTSFEFEVVNSLPATGVKGKIYLVAATGGSGQNIYEEFIWITNKYERLGTTDIDLSGYVLSSDLVRITNAEIDTICAA